VYSLITERLADNGPAGALLGVARLVFPDMLVEIEATALVS
jgi:enamine deaminase RidA (YjgF/YER057c/UK114 family)